MIDDESCPSAAHAPCSLRRTAESFSRRPDPTMTAPTVLDKPARAAPAHADRFPVPTAELERVAAVVLDAAHKGGATAAETDV